MNSPLYPTEILRLAATIPYQERLADPMGTSEKRSPICGSRVTVDINLDENGLVSELGILARACAYGQASSNIFASMAIGKSSEALALARDDFASWLNSESGQPDWPGIDNFPPDRLNVVRRAAVQLAFEAAAEAAALAAAKQGKI